MLFSDRFSVADVNELSCIIVCCSIRRVGRGWAPVLRLYIQATQVHYHRMQIRVPIDKASSVVVVLWQLGDSVVQFFHKTRAEMSGSADTMGAGAKVLVKGLVGGTFGSAAKITGVLSVSFCHIIHSTVRCYRA